MYCPYCNSEGKLAQALKSINFSKKREKHMLCQVLLAPPMSYRTIQINLLNRNLLKDRKEQRVMKERKKQQT